MDTRIPPKTQWEHIDSEEEVGLTDSHTARLKVPGGWLYRVDYVRREEPDDPEGQIIFGNLCFVPDPSRA